MSYAESKKKVRLIEIGNRKVFARIWEEGEMERGW